MADEVNPSVVAFRKHFDPEVVHDLLASGLIPEDMAIRPLSQSEAAATNAGKAKGYVIPYYDLKGNALPFYRVKLTSGSDEVKYKQPRNTPNHIYFPPGFFHAMHEAFADGPHKRRRPRVIVLTEGEKKAALAVKLGIPCVAVSGVDSWKSRTIVLPKDTQLISGGAKKEIRAKLPHANAMVPELAQLAIGFGDLIDVLTQYNAHLVIIFDSDRLGTLRSEVQRAATMLAYEFRYLGITSNRIRQLVLPDVPTVVRNSSVHRPSGLPFEEPPEPGKEKTALDDFLLAMGGADLVSKLADVIDDPASFPRHPNPKGFINVQLDGPVTRKDCSQIASVILSELDARGTRLREANTGKPFYYDRSTHKLMPATLIDSRGEPMHESPFGTLLYQEYGLSGNDKRVLVWLASQYTGEEPIFDVQPRRVCAIISESEDPSNIDGIAFQASDTTFFAVSPDPKRPLELRTNGDYNILFEQKQVEPVDTDRVMELFDEYLAEAKANKWKLNSWWDEVLHNTSLGRGKNDVLDEEGNAIISQAGERMITYATLLFYVSPFFQRWRGTQLPVEIITGEPGSGKSSIYNLRLQVLTGRPHLRNLPTDIRDWYSSITNAGGLHCTDNVHFSNRDLKQRLSDEICRLITEPKPEIEMRVLYTNAEQIRIPVTATFAFTALSLPFGNADLIQRSIIFEAANLGNEPDGDWVIKQISERGGREAWVAHQLVFMHLFLRYANLPVEEGGWNTDFRTGHRLAHLEQCLKIAARVLGIESRELGSTMTEIQNTGLLETDWTMKGLKDFTTHYIKLYGGKKLPKDIRFIANDICDWAESDEEHCENKMLVQPRRLGRYMSQNKAQLKKMLGVIPATIQQNRIVWCFLENIVNPYKAGQ